MKSYEDAAAEFKNLGLEKVKEKLDNGRYGGQNKKWAEAWVNAQEQLDAKECQNRSEHRDEEALSIAKKANILSEESNTLSKKANKKSCIANICSKLALLFSLASIVVSNC